jgi:hypothetical protein
LEIVVVDPARLEQACRVGKHAGRRRCETGGPEAEQPVNSDGGQAEIGSENEQGPDHDRQTLGKRGVEPGSQPQYQRRDRGVDEPRPVHGRALGGVHAVLDRIKPRLPGQKVADRHKAHGIVVIRQDQGKGIVEGRKAAAQEVDDREQDDGAQHRRIVEQRNAVCSGTPRR